MGGDFLWVWGINFKEQLQLFLPMLEEALVGWAWAPEWNGELRVGSLANGPGTWAVPFPFK